MKLPDKIVRLFNYDVSDIVAAMPDMTSPVWDANPHRQNKHNVHTQTRSIIFEWIDDAWQPGQPAIVKTSDCGIPALTDAVYACAQTMNARYRGKIIRLLLAELVPHGRIPPHQDMGSAVVLVHRLHLPVVTNPNVRFFVDGVPHYLDPGGVFEFDNTRSHAVDNASDSSRVHLMCDILPASMVL